MVVCRTTQFVTYLDSIEEEIKADELKNGRCYLIIGHQDEKLRKAEEQASMRRKFRIVTGVDENTANSYLESCYTANSPAPLILEVNYVKFFHHVYIYKECSLDLSC